MHRVCLVAILVATCASAVLARDVARAATEEDPDMPNDDEWGVEWGERDPCVAGGPFAAALPSFLEHCGPLAMTDSLCTQPCYRAFSIVSSYSVCLQDALLGDRAQTQGLEGMAGLKPEEALQVTFMMAFSRCHTANLLPSGPSSPTQYGGPAQCLVLPMAPTSVLRVLGVLLRACVPVLSTGARSSCNTNSRWTLSSHSAPHVLSTLPAVCVFALRSTGGATKPVR